MIADRATKLEIKLPAPYGAGSFILSAKLTLVRLSFPLLRLDLGLSSIACRENMPRIHSIFLLFVLLWLGRFESKNAFGDEQIWV